MFVRLADRLASEGFAVLRFSFRGHGHSGGTQRGVTIAGEMLDLQAATELALRGYGPPLRIVAASFGAVSTLLSLPYLRERLAALVLWNPVLDLRGHSPIRSCHGDWPTLGRPSSSCWASKVTCW